MHWLIICRLIIVVDDRLFAIHCERRNNARHTSAYHFDLVVYETSVEWRVDAPAEIRHSLDIRRNLYSFLWLDITQ